MHDKAAARSFSKIYAELQARSWFKRINTSKPYAAFMLSCCATAFERSSGMQQTLNNNATVASVLLSST
jgi:hypothetical protein